MTANARFFFFFFPLEDQDGDASHSEVSAAL